MLRDPCRPEDTICTATVPQGVFTVRTYASRQDYEPVSAQIHRSLSAYSQATALRSSEPLSGDKSQVSPVLVVLRFTVMLEAGGADTYAQRAIPGSGLKLCWLVFSFHDVSPVRVILP